MNTREFGGKLDSSKHPWPIATVFGTQERIDTNPDFQRPAVWSRPQKQLLIDTILRGYDIPKFYWRKVAKNPDYYEVVDGQQRLRAIWEYKQGEYALHREAEPIDGHLVASTKYASLPDDLRMRFDIYALDIVVMQDTDEDEVREMFLRLQNGTTLKAQERRNAMTGNMREFVREISQHEFFEECAFANSRYTFDHVAAQMTLIELNGGPTNVRDANLNAMYEHQKEFDLGGKKAKKIQRTLNYLLEAFPNKTPELKRYIVVSLYTMVSKLLEKYVVQGRQEELANWFIAFELYRMEQASLPEDAMDPDMVIYQEKTRYSTDALDSISWRHEFLLRKFFEASPDIELKDDQRLFTDEQRIAIFRRDEGRCKVRIKCEGSKCEWGNWHADHRVPWSQGGKTMVANGQMACIPCNTAKGGD